MPRKVVYGKKTNKASAFAVSNVFLSSSPTKISRPSTAASSKSQNGTIEEAAIAFGKLHIEEKDEEIENNKNIVTSKHVEQKRATTGKERKALGPRDANSRGPTKTREIIQRHLKRTKNDLKTHETQDITNTREIRDAVPKSPRRAQKAEPILMEQSIQPDPSCDPYIAPLISLTNDQTLPISFEEWSNELSTHFRISKIAEASYGEVYRLSLTSPHPTLTSSDESVLKILVLKPDPSTEIPGKKKSGARIKREETMSEVAGVESEVKLLKRMTEVPGFTNYRALHILKGRPSESFKIAWKTWNNGRKRGKKSDFPDPSIRASYGDETLWAVIEMQDAGTDVDELQGEGKLTSIYEIWDVFWQVVIAIGKGEEDAHFEHRDLHCGNICVRAKCNSSKRKEEDKPKRKLGFTNLETTIIDYTLARAEIPIQNNLKSSFSSSQNSRRSSIDSKDDDLEIAYLDLAIPTQDWVFEGNADQDYQYDIYRYMRSAMYFSDPEYPYEGHKEEAGESGRTWKGFHPQTNLIWLHFVLYTLLEGLHPEKRKDDEKAEFLDSVLREVEKRLEVGCIPCEGLMSARDLVAIALKEGWLDDEDVRCMA
jgi:serine/threonine-protein kinase haspin